MWLLIVLSQSRVFTDCVWSTFLCQSVCSHGCQSSAVSMYLLQWLLFSAKGKEPDPGIIMYDVNGTKQTIPYYATSIQGGTPKYGDKVNLECMWTVQAWAKWEHVCVPLVKATCCTAKSVVDNSECMMVHCAVD